MLLENMGKYTVVSGKIVNRLTKDPIPDDEPVMIFRARDKHVVDMLDYYSDLVSSGDHKEALLRRRWDFTAFSNANRARMKEPDTRSSLPPKETPKYAARDELIVNLDSGEAIPPDEPVLVLRAKDKHAVEAMLHYNFLCADPSQGEYVNAMARKFKSWAAMEFDSVKEPDSAGEVPKFS